MKKKGILFVTFALIFALLLSTVSVSAGLAKGWADIDGLKKNGGTIKGATSFKVFYTASRQGTYKADLYQVYPNDKSKKKTCVKTVSFNCNKKIKVKEHVAPKRRDKSFGRA